MKLHYAPGACSLAPHIALRETGLPFALSKVELHGSGRTEDGRDFRTVNPKGYVPALELDDGSVLTEVGVLLQYVADRKPETGLAPKAGTMERYRLQEWLNFIATEIHKGYGPLWNPKADDAEKDRARQRLAGRFDWLSRELDKRDHLAGPAYCIADAYLFTVLNWSRWTGVDLSRWPVLTRYVARIASRPAVQEALRAEGLLE